MSLNRLIYYSAVIGGWAAFLGWLVSAMLDRSGTALPVWLIAALVGGAIGAGLNLVAGMANAQWKQLLKRLGIGLMAAGAGGAVGGFLGNLLFTLLSNQQFLGVSPTRVLGWMVMGAGIGVVEGLYERSSSKLRNGLIGGVTGGFLGGCLFDPISRFLAGSGMSSRATAFVILGLCIGLLIGLVKVVLKDAWLTVLDGYRPGRQLILAESKTLLGRAEYATLPFMGRNDAEEVDAVHAQVLRLPDGRFAIEDNGSRTGVRVNNVRIDGRTLLNDGDVIRIGMNMVRFSERHRREGAAASAGDLVETSTAAPPSPSPSPSPSPVPVAPQPPVAGTPSPTRPSPLQAAPPRPPLAPAPAPRPLTAAPPIQPAGPPPRPAAAPPSSSPPPRPAAAPPSSSPPPRPAAAPPSSPPPKPAVPAAGGGTTTCPSCGRQLPSNQRYCIICDLNF